jgi:hypothetical protein
MGRRDQNQSTTVPSPADKHLEFQGSKGYYQYYDKDKKENVVVKNPKFLIVQEMTTITGWNKASGGLYSNEIQDIQTEHLNVRYFKGDNKEIASGLYKDIKEKVYSRAIGGKFARSIWVALRINKEWQLQNIQLTGKQLTSWITMQDDLKLKAIPSWKIMVSIESIEYDDSGAIKYYFPKFKYEELDEANEAHKAVLIKADNFHAIWEDYHTKKKAGVTSDAASPRQSADNSPGAPKAEKNTTDAEKSSFVPDEDEEDDFPF